MLRRIVHRANAGTVAGCSRRRQHLKLIPLIAAAEVYEAAGGIPIVSRMRISMARRAGMGAGARDRAGRLHGVADVFCRHRLCAGADRRGRALGGYAIDAHAARYGRAGFVVFACAGNRPAADCRGWGGGPARSNGGSDRSDDGRGCLIILLGGARVAGVG
jgi:hypothetical protein